MPRLKKQEQESVSAMAAARVAENPRGAPLTLPAPTCVLDGLPVNSTLTVFLEGGKRTPFVMATYGQVPVPEDDASWKLPELAEIRRISDTEYRARQLNSGLDQPDLICPTAIACVQGFLRHFHNVRD